MARVAGIDLPKNKRIDVALEYIYGIGKHNAKDVLAKTAGQIDPATRVKDITEAQANLLNTILQKEYKVEGELRREVAQNIHRYIETGSYRGSRHRKRLPVRGQRTKTNSRTRKGKRRTVGAKAAAAAK